MELLASFIKSLVCVFLTTVETLEFGEVFARGKHFLQSLMLVFESLELGAYVLKCKAPLLLEHVIFFEAGTYMALILLVMLCNLRLALLEDFNFKAALSWPLLT